MFETLAAALAKAFMIFQEIAPVAQIAVAAVQATAPAGTSGATKFAAASTAVNDAVNAASAAEGAFTNTKAAIASGNADLVATTTGHTIETVLSVLKTFNAFPKAGIVQSAAPLPTAAASPVDVGVDAGSDTANAPD